MRIAMIGQKRAGSREGGVEVVVGELARRMAALGHEVTCYDRMGAGAPSKPHERDGYRVVPVKTWDRKGLAALSSSFSATKLALESRPDVVHYHAEGPCVSLWLARMAGIRTVTTIHGLDWQRAKWGGLASAYIKLGERMAAKHSDELIVLSKGNQEYFRESYGREAAVIPNGASPQAPVSADFITRKWKLEPEGYYLFCARIVPEKGLAYLIEAYGGLSTERKLVVAGASDSSEHMGRIRHLAQNDPRILFAGHVEGRALEELYSNAYAFVLPSDVEGMPMSLLEAMSYGRACVTSDIPECSDVLDGCGKTFPKGDVKALRASLELLDARPDLVRSMEEGARKRIGLAYDWDRVVEKTLELYEGRGEARIAFGDIRKGVRA